MSKLKFFILPLLLIVQTSWSYVALQEPTAPIALNTMSDWIIAHTKK